MKTSESSKHIVDGIEDSWLAVTAFAWVLLFLRDEHGFHKIP